MADKSAYKSRHFWVIHMFYTSPASHASRRACLMWKMHAFSVKVWTGWWHDSSGTLKMHISFKKCTFSQAFVPFKGCFEKVEEWLDDNKHLLGTIGMVILVVQVGVRNCSFLLQGFLSHLSCLPYSSFCFVSHCIRLCLPVWQQVKKKMCASSGLCATIIYSTWGLCSVGFLGTHTHEISLEMLKSLSSAP